MIVRVSRYRLRIDLPNVLFVTGIVAFCGWYLWNAYSASSNVQNMLLIEPASILAFVLYLLILRESVHVEPLEAAAEATPPVRPERERPGRRVVGSMILLGLYVFSMARIGFDLATYLYILASLALLGERRVAVLVVVPLLSAGLIVYGLSAASSIPLPLLFRWGR